MLVERLPRRLKGMAVLGTDSTIAIQERLPSEQLTQWLNKEEQKDEYTDRGDLVETERIFKSVSQDTGRIERRILERFKSVLEKWLKRRYMTHRACGKGIPIMQIFTSQWSNMMPYVWWRTPIHALEKTSRCRNRPRTMCLLTMPTKPVYWQNKAYMWGHLYKRHGLISKMI